MGAPSTTYSIEVSATAKIGRGRLLSPGCAATIQRASSAIAVSVATFAAR